MYKKRRSRRRNEKKRLYLTRALVVIGLGAIGGLLYFALKTNAWERLNNSIESVTGGLVETEATDKTIVPVSMTPAEVEFRNFLETSTPQRLILRSTELIDNEQEALLERLGRQDQKIQIADRLLQIKDNARANNYGKFSKLKALRVREVINFDHSLTTESSISELQDYAYRASNSNNPEIADEAELGKLYARLFRTLIFEDTSNVQVIEPVLREFVLVCQNRLKDADVAREIYGLLERIHVRSPETSSRRFVMEYKSVFKGSPSSAIRERAAAADKEIIEAEFDFVDVYGTLAVDKSESMDKLFQQVRDAIERPNISSQGYKVILQQTENLGSYGRYEQALECARLLQRRIASRDSLLPIVKAAQVLRQRYQMAGTKFDFSIVKKTSSDEQFSVRFPDSSVKAILFFDSQSIGETQKSIEFLMGIAGRYMVEKEFCCSLFLLNDGDSPQTLREFFQIEKLMPAIDTGIIDVESDSGKEIVRRFSIESLPQLILLDRDSRVAAVNLELVDFERRLKEMLGKR